MAAAGLAAFDSCLKGCPGRQGGGLQVEGVRQVLVAGDVRVDAHVAHPLLDLVELGEPRFQACLVAHHAGVLGHHVADGTLQGPDVFMSVGGQQVVKLRAGRGKRLGRARLGFQRGRVLGGRPRHDAPEDQQFDQRVSAQAVRAMQAAGSLADGVEPLDIGAVVLRANPDPAHRVVRGRCDLDRFLRDVQHLQFQHCLVDARQPVHDGFARQVGDIQPNTAVRGAAPFLDLGVGGQSHAVPGREFLADRVVALHEPLPQPVAQDASLAAGRLGDECAGSVFRFDDARGVELHELGVAQARAGVDGQAERVAGVLVAARGGAAPDAVVSAGGQDDGVGMDEVALAAVDVEAVGAEHLVPAHQQPGDVDLVEDRDVQLLGAVHQAALDFQAGVVTGKGCAAEGVRTEEALGDAPVFLAGKAHPVAFQVGDSLRRSAGDDLHGVGVGQVVAFLDGVGGVLLPAVFLVHGAECGVDAAGGERGVCVVARALAHGEHIDAHFGQLDSSPEARSTGADDQDGGGNLSFVLA